MIKTRSLLILFIFASLLTVQLAYAITYEMSTCPVGTLNHVRLGYTTSGSLKEGVGQSITPTTSLFLSSAKFSIQRIGSPTGSLTARLLNESDKTILENSTTSIGTDEIGILAHDWYEFSFSETYNLTTTSTYLVMLYLETGYSGFSSSNYIDVAFDTSSGAPNGPGQGYRYTTIPSWQTDSLFDCAHYIYGSDGPAATPAPTTYPTIDPNADADAIMNSLIDYAIPVVVTLLPVLFIWLLGGRGKWPMLIGVTIGVGVGYVFGLVPVWLVFLVSIAIVGMAYQSVRSGN